MSQMGHTSSALALEVYARKMERRGDTGERMDALSRGAEWTTAEVEANATESTVRVAWASSAATATS